MSRDSSLSFDLFFPGVATTLARLGFSEETISAQGRWSSACYNRSVNVMSPLISENGESGTHVSGDVWKRNLN